VAPVVVEPTKASAEPAWQISGLFNSVLKFFELEGLPTLFEQPSKELKSESMERNVEPATIDLWEDLEQLKQRVSLLEKRITELESEKSPATYIELRDISYPEVKEEIAQYFLKNDGKEIGYEELIEELKIDPKMVVQACNELLEEGKIG
jgi:hypothetical protein